MDLNECYKLLGLQRGATAAEIKRAYREMAVRYHPDSYNDHPLRELAEEQMKKINNAYSELKKHVPRESQQDQGGEPRRKEERSEKKANQDQRSNSKSKEDQKSQSEEPKKENREETVIYCACHPTEKSVARCMYCGSSLCSRCTEAFRDVCVTCVEVENRENFKGSAWQLGKTVLISILIAWLTFNPYGFVLGVIIAWTHRVNWKLLAQTVVPCFLFLSVWSPMSILVGIALYCIVLTSRGFGRSLADVYMGPYNACVDLKATLRVRKYIKEIKSEPEGRSA